MSERLYNRQVFLEIGVPGQQFRRFEDLRISAKVKKTRGGEPNSAEIDVYNVAPDSIAAAQEDGAIVRLFAGYSVPRQIFIGAINPSGAVVKKETVNRVLQIEAKDGGTVYRTARINQTFDRGTDLEQVFDALAQQTGLPLGSVEVPQGAQLTQGVTLTGRVSDALDTLARSLGAEISFQDQALQIIPRDGFAPGEAILLTSEPEGRNLIGAPAPTDDGIELRSLLDGRYLPGKRIKLESAEYNGIYKILSVDHALDSGWDQSFYSDLVCREA